MTQNFLNLNERFPVVLQPTGISILLISTHEAGTNHVPFGETARFCKVTCLIGVGLMPDTIDPFDAATDE